MARQGYATNPAEKKLEVFYRFDGGMNTVTANENMADNEVLLSKNLDLMERGPVKRRYGMVKHLATPSDQGFFRFYRTESDFDELTAGGGKLYKNGAVLPIAGLTGGFQTERLIEAVQFQQRLWIATGTKLVEYDGTVAKVVEPYRPQPLEALYIGTNGLADDPSNFMQDGEAISMRIDGVTFSQRYGVVNRDVLLTAYKSTPPGKLVDFLFEYRHTFMEEGKWLLGRDWDADKTYNFKTDIEGDIQFRVSMREAGKEIAEAQYLIPKFKVKPVPDPNDVNVPTERLDDCNRILLHWNRILLYGDPTQPDALYISHLNNPRYIPIPNSLRFENGRNEDLTAIVGYRDMLVGFTSSTIQALFGKSPMDFKRITLNTAIGCIAPQSAKVMRNYIYFLSFDGVYMLKTVGYTEDKANVEKVDTKIANLIPAKKNACAAVHEGQYHIVFPDENRRFRLYYSLNAWTMDESPKLDFKRLTVIDNVLYGQSASVVKFDKSKFDDDGFVYEDVLETKSFDFGQPYHIKKLKEAQFITSPFRGITTTKASVYILADSAIAITPDTSGVVIDSEGNVSWQASSSPNLTAVGGAVMGEWKLGVNPFGTVETSIDTLPVAGKCRRVRIRIAHEENLPYLFLGMGIIFKLKRP